MRSTAMVLAMVALLTVSFAVTALAVNKQCTGYPCFGGDSDDKLFERAGNGVGDRIYSKPGNDVVDVDAFASDTDIIYAGKGRDTLKADDGDERDDLYGERGIDTCYVDAREEVDNSCNHLWVNGDKVR